MVILGYFVEMVKVLFSTAEDMQFVRASLLLLYLSGVLSGLLLVLAARLISAIISRIKEKRSF